MSNKRYDPELRKKILRFHLEKGCTIKNLTKEYNLGSGTLRYWLDKHRRECENNPELQQEMVNLYYFYTIESLDGAVSDYVYDWYNHRRPRTYSGGIPPGQVGYAT